MKKNILLATAIVVIGLMIAVSCSTAINVQEQEKQTLYLDRNPNIELAGMNVAPIAGEVQLFSTNVEPLAVPVVIGAHPGVASDSLGYVVLGFEDDSPNVWFTASDDEGENWATDAVGWMIDPAPTLPDVDSCGDGRFIGGMVPDYLASDGSELYKVEVTDPMDFATPGYDCPYWDWWDVGDGYTDFDAIAVAGYTSEDPAENTWAFGGHSIIGDHPVSGTDTPFFSYQFDDTGYAWIYRWTGINGCTCTAHDIDSSNLYSYAAWNYDNAGEQDIYFSITDFSTWVPVPPSYQQHPDVGDGAIDSTGNDNYIDISALNDNIIIVSERDGDIVAYYSLDGMVTIGEASIDTGADNPRIVHLSDLIAICSYVKGGSVYYSVTENGGETWSTPEMINEPENDFVPQEFKASDVCGFGSAWMNTDDTNVYFAGVTIGNAPGAPTITGPNGGKPNQAYDFKFNAVDSDGNKVKYIINWGDGKTNTTDFATSGTDVTVSHTWDTQGTYTITAKAQDTFGNVGPEGTKDINIPKSKTVNYIFLKFLERFPIMELIYKLLGL